MTRYLTIALLAAVAALTPCSLQAQLGNDNPTGISGQFNGNVNTGGSYDPYTGNATRSVTDIVVAGGVGQYPLAFTRTMNSRYYVEAAYQMQFGAPGTWRHSYQWTITSPVTYGENSMPTEYNVTYPDGRRLIFRYSAQDPQAFRAGPGVADRLEPLDVDFDGHCALVLPDGGSIRFAVRVSRDATMAYRTTYTYTVKEIIDPHGLVTQIIDGGTYLKTIKEPAGRTLSLHYTFNGQLVLDRVVGSDGRTVQYRYSSHWTGGVNYTALTSVEYFGDPSLTARYTYQNDNTTRDGRPLIASCDDTMFGGPMKKIAYDFVPGSQGGAYGQLLREKHPDGTHVSTLSISGNSRTETRGDIPAGGGAPVRRSFDYSGGKLTSWTDFKNQRSYKYYDGNGFEWAVTDARGHTTTTLREPLIGANEVTTHHDQTTRAYSYPAGNPYFVQYWGNERGKNTYYNRDGNDRVIRIDYADYPNNNPYETFTYNGFGQVLTHRMTSGGTESFGYDARGLKIWYRDPYRDPIGKTGKPSFWYQYDSKDRLWKVTDHRGAYAGDLAYTTTYEYNARGQVTRVIHPDGNYLQNAYNPDGTLAWTADENHPGATTDANQRTRYAYDDYKRITSVTDATNRAVSFGYHPYGGGGGNSYTAPAVYGVYFPSGRYTHHGFDENLRKAWDRQAPGTAGEDAFSGYSYDAAGNLTGKEDFLGRWTTFGYDNRNRRISRTNPAPVNNQVTRWEYDAVGNMSKETRPDGIFRSWQYDSLNRLQYAYDWRTNPTPTSAQTTTYTRDLAGNVTRITDAKGAEYSFGYDLLNRKTSATYPLDKTGISRQEFWGYDPLGNVSYYRNPAYQYRYFTYDSRNRNTYNYWSGTNVGPAITTVFDPASRVTSISTNNQAVTNQTVVTFGYDWANRQTSETQTVAGHATQNLTYEYNEDGMRSYMGTNAHSVRYRYDMRNNVAGMRDGATNWEWWTFAYDLNGNQTQRRTQWGPGQGYAFDELNRMTIAESFHASAVFARTHYVNDSNNRVYEMWRDEHAGSGEKYQYNAMGQLDRVSYWTDWANYNNPQRTVSYNLDALNRTGYNGVQVNANGMQTTTDYTPNALNQYNTVGGVSLSYDAKFNLTSYNGGTHTFNGQNQMTSATKSGASVQTVHDGLGRPLKRVYGTTVRINVYDGWSPVAEFDGANNNVCWNLFGTQGPDDILMRVGAGIRIYHKDRLGSIAYLTDAGTGILEQYRYDAFGEPTMSDWGGGNARTNSTQWNRFLFTGREWISELGLYDYRNRWYHPKLGRFLQPDPLGFAAGDNNLFRYCGGDPVNRVDPYGLDEMPPPRKHINLGSNGYTPTGTHIPQTVTGISDNGGFTWRLTAHDAVNGHTNIPGSFALLNLGPSAERPTVVRAMTAADITRGFYGNFGEKLNAAIGAVFGSDANKIPTQTVENAPMVLLVNAEQIAQLTGRPVGTTAGFVSEHTVFGGDTPNGAMYVLAGQPRMESFRTYGHELGNLLDLRYFGAGNVHSNPRITWDWDTGAALEEALFGPPRFGPPEGR